MDKVKNIVATFLKVEPSEINEETLMDRTAIPGSVLIHRMYSTLSSEGFQVADKRSIRTYGDLIKTLGGASESLTDEVVEVKKETKEIVIDDNASPNIDVGIDMEDIANMPVVTDYREEKFYTDNFSDKEISHCILQVNPLASFAGKFAAKEAVVKADNTYQSTSFNEIEILNNDAGKPVFKDFSISISHTETQAIAIAMKLAISFSL